MIELLAPAGTLEKLKIAFYYGADAVYFAGKQFGLRAFAGNFSDEEIFEAANYAHKLGKKVYVTVNIIARDSDFVGLDKYLSMLEQAKIDGLIVADLGVVKYIRDNAPNLDVHVSTQANIINSYSAKLLADMGVKRIVLARELSLKQIEEIRNNLNKDVELECFVHGAMCISYSGRCLLSNYLTGRDSNRGECVQACRWQYCITEKSREGEEYEIQEDKNGTYILNSKDLNMISHLNELKDVGVTSFKIEGRMKSEYYVANVVNAYRRAIDNTTDIKLLESELLKSSHRKYTTGFYFGANDKECLESSMPVQTEEFMAIVVEDTKDGYVKVQQRNRFKIGDTLEVLSPNENFNKPLVVTEMLNEKNEFIDDAKAVQQILRIKTDLSLKAGDMLRK